MVCKKYYVQQVVDEMTNGKTFRMRPDVDREKWRLDARQKMKDLGINIGKVDDGVQDPAEGLSGNMVLAHARVFPRFYASVKSHKLEMLNKVLFRFLTSAVNITISPACEWLAYAFRSLQPLWDEIWVKALEPLGIKLPGCWIVSSAAQVPDRVRNFNTVTQSDDFMYGAPIDDAGYLATEDKGFRSYDFSNMYATIPVDDLLARTESWIHRCFSVQSEKGFYWLYVSRTKGMNRWLTKEEGEALKKPIPPSRLLLDVDTMVKLMTFVLTHMMVEMGGIFLEQIDGIPMGLSPCVYLANGYLFSYDLEWFEYQLVAEPLTNLRRRFLRRVAIGVITYVDDMIAKDVNLVPILMRSQFGGVESGIFPFALSIEQVQCPGAEPGDLSRGVFLELWLDRDDNGVYTSMFNKWDFLPLKPRRFPSLDTAIAEFQKLGVVTSRCHTFVLCCMRREGLIVAIVDLLTLLREKGYSWDRLRKQLVKFGPKFAGLVSEVGSLDMGPNGWKVVVSLVDNRMAAPLVVAGPKNYMGAAVA